MDRPTITRPFLHLLHLICFFSLIVKGLEYDKSKVEVKYACEDKMLEIKCKEGEFIHVIRAIYGRYSITICNEHGNTDWSVNCVSTKTIHVLYGRCSEKSHCRLQAVSSLFGDPCPGTLKYLEVQYECRAASTGRPSPTWLITTQSPNVWGTKSPTSRPPPPPPPPNVSAITTWTPVKLTTSTAATTVVTSVIPSKQPPLVPVEPIESLFVPPVLEKKTPTQNNEQTYQSSSEEQTTLPYSATVFPNNKPTEENVVTNKYISTSSIPWTENYNIKKCSPTTARNLFWNWTQVGDRSVQACPGGTNGSARWKCIQINNTDDPQWYPATPDLSECRSIWLTNLESRVMEGDSLISISSDLSQVTSSKTLYGGDMMITTKIIKKMAQKMSEDIQTFGDLRQREAIVTELLHGVVRTGSNLLDSSQHPSWRDLSYKEQMRVATSLLIGLEENAFLLADTVDREKTVEQTVKNIMLSVRVLQIKNIKTAVFPSDATTDKWSASNDWLELPRRALLENSESELVRLVFVAFDRLEDILQWQPESVFDSENVQRNISRILNSKIISASLGKGRHIQLPEPVRLFLKHLKTENVSNPSCVFWDYTMSSWSEEGCYVESTNRTHTTCLCNHLTNFAILMDVHATYLPATHQIALQIITYVGCIISIVCLVLTFFTFQVFKALKSDRTTIHKHLCFCLLIAELLFVIGIGQTSDRVICGVVAGLLHLFFLCAFAWMFLEGFQLYVMLIEVFETEKSRLRWYYTSAYGIPLFIVAISAIIDPYSYGTENYCWLRADNFFIFSFVGPVILVLLANIVFLVMAVIIMCRHGNTSVSIKSKEHSRLASARTWLRGAFILVFLLGLTWTFGLLYLNKESVTMAYIFTTLNSLQGLFIFVFHCIQNEKVRKEYHKYIRRHSWLPKCLRCSKSSASGAGSSGSGSSGLGKERGTSLYAGSVGNTSALNSHSTDNSGSSPHGTSVGTNVNNIIISNNLNNSANIRPSSLVQVLNHHNNASTTTTTNHNRLHNVSQVVIPRLKMADIGKPPFPPNLSRKVALVCTILLQQYILQRGWSSRSCTTMNRIGKSPVLVTSSIAATMVVTTSRIHRYQQKVDNEEGDGTVTLPSPTSPVPMQEYNDDEFSVNTINNATLPYFRNSNKGSNSIICSGSENNSISNLNFPKSASSWGPLHKPMHWKNISFKSFSRDSGHGASEQEESPHSHMTGSNDMNDCRFNNTKNTRKHQMKSANLNLDVTPTSNLPEPTQADLSKYLYRTQENYQYATNKQNASGQNQLQVMHQPNIKKKNNGGMRATSPWNHTYTEIHDNRSKRSSISNNEEDPVYEEIERNEIQVSDMSDEDGKRQSDMSRQSSRSYGDHKPLIPYSPAIDRNINSCLEVMTKHRTKEHGRYLTDYRLTRPNIYRGENARSLAAVLDGETVVCHLEPDMFPHDSYNSRTLFPSYNKS